MSRALIIKNELTQSFVIMFTMQFRFFFDNYYTLFLLVVQFLEPVFDKIPCLRGVCVNVSDLGFLGEYHCRKVSNTLVQFHGFRFQFSSLTIEMCCTTLFIFVLIQ